MLGVILFGAALEALFDIAPQYILTAHHFHRLHYRGANNWLAGAGGESPDPVVGVVGDLCVEAHQLAGEHQAPG